MGVNLIRTSKVISLDSNIFIRALDDPTVLGEKSRELIKQIREITPRVFISTIVLEEFFVRVYKDKREKEITDIIDFLTIDGIVVLVDVNQEIALLAAKIRSQFDIKAPDAIHLASAIESGAEIFITTDRKLPRKIGKLTIKILA